MSSVRTLLWAMRIAWSALVPATAPAIGAALNGVSDPVRIVAQAGLWAAWAVVLLATLIPLPAALTVARLGAPGAPAVAVAAAIGGAGPLAAAVAVAVALVATVLIFTAEVGGWFVQGGAYGDEARFLLKPPGALVLGPLELAWAVLAAAVTAGPLLLAAQQWVAGAVVTVIAVALAVALGRRFHRLSLRWFVFVPAGVVVRDPLALADTAMFRRATVASMRLAPADTTATDLTAGALGPAVEVLLRQPGLVVWAGTVHEHQSRGAEVDALLVSPSRPGRMLAEAERRGYAATPPASTNVSVSS